ncbi:MAG: helix-turn-helix transcriptional regulator, partial [Planctomycetota bacterium]|nr:helix-turn-helix transcriptional regulator [Planctomycetota bacterium]
KLFGSAPELLMGQRGEGAFSREFLEERRGLLRRALDEHRPIVLHETVRGWRSSTLVQPLKTTSGKRRALVIWRPEAASGLLEDEPNALIVHARHNDGDLLADLTRTERKILAMIGDGLSMAEIADSMDRSVKTIEWHRASIGRKLNVGNRVEIARIALKAGICSLRLGEGAARAGAAGRG